MRNDIRAPISGGQYHWVSEFAPPQYQKPLSYITGMLPPTKSLPKKTPPYMFLAGAKTRR